MDPGIPDLPPTSLPAEIDRWAQAKAASGHFDEIISGFGRMLESPEADSARLNAWIGYAHLCKRAFSEALPHLVRAMEADGLSKEMPFLSAWMQSALVHRPHDTSRLQHAAILERDSDGFHRCLLELITGANTGSRDRDWDGSRYLDFTLAFYALKAKYRYFSIEELKDDEVSQLVAEGIAPQFLELVKRGPVGVARAVQAKLAQFPWNLDDSLSPRVKEVATTVSARRKYLISPFTGELASTIHSVGEELYLFVEAGQPCFVSQHGPIDAPLQDTTWIFPTAGIILTTKQRLATAARPLALCYESIVKHADEFRRYLTDTERKLCVGAISAPHVGHHIWNEISGWSRLFATMPAQQQIEYFTNWKASKIFGNVRDLFPDCISESARVEELESGAALAPLIFSKKLLHACLCDSYVTEDTATRIIAKCYEDCSAEFLDKLHDLRRRSKPLVLVTLRLDNRTWVEQGAGIPRIIEALSHDFQDIGFVLDGLNTGLDLRVAWTHADMSLADERLLAESIIGACKHINVPIFNSIGCSIKESIVVADVVDAFIAPVGAGMAKYRWITNKPGVAFSNETFLGGHNHNGTLYDRFRDHPIRSRFVSVSAVRDVERERNGQQSRANFSMNWEAPYRLAREMLLDIEQSPR
jgi:hypothetical protein